MVRREATLNFPWGIYFNQEQRRKRMKKVCFVVMMVLIFSGFSLALAVDGLKVGCVDLQRVVENCEIGKKLNGEIQQDVEKARQKLAEKDQELKKLRDVLDRQSLAMNEDVKQEKLKEYQTKARDLERMAKDSEDDLRQKYAEKKQKILQDIVEIIRQYGKDKVYSIILEKGLSVIYAVDSYDVTDEVIKAFNDKFAPKAPAEKPQQPKEKEKDKDKK
jgi:outer membrane protein